MMEINSYALLIAVLVYYGIGMSGLYLFRKVVKLARPSKALYIGLFVESIAIVAGTAGIVYELAYVPIGEALLTTGALGLCYTVAASLIQPTSGSTPSMRGRAIIGGYRLLGILCATVALYQWG